MLSIKPSRTEMRVIWWIAALVFAGLLFASARKYPSLFADEYFYSRFARLIPLSESTVPNYLFFLVYSITNECGSNFLFCGRFLNTIFFVATAPLIYLTALNYCTPKNAAWTAVLSLFAPFSYYTALYMPESMFYFFCWVFIWRVSRAAITNNTWDWVLAGFTLGLLTLVKPHALFLIPSTVLYMFWLSRQVNIAPFVRMLSTCVILVGTCIAVKFTVGYLIAGQAGVTLFGSMYGSLAKNQSGGFDRYLQLLAPWAENTVGHVLGMLTLFALAIFWMLSSAFTDIRSKSRDQIQRTSISVYTLLIVGSMLCVSSLFTASVLGAGAAETILRLHMRYYNFTFPLFFIVLGAHVLAAREKLYQRRQLVVASSIVICLGFVFFTDALTRFTIYTADSPELRGLIESSVFFKVTVGASCLATVLALRFPSISTTVVLYLVLPIVLLGSTYFGIKENRARLQEHVFDAPGLLAQRFLSKAEIGTIAVVGVNAEAVYQALFHIDHAKALPVFIDDSEKFELKNRPIGTDWVLMLDQNKKFADVSFAVERRGFTLVRAKIPFKINLSAPDLSSALLEDVDGVSWPEPWGRWTEGKRTRITFSNILPSTFKVVIHGYTLNANAKKPFIARVGNCEQTFFLQTIPSKVRLEFTCETRSNFFDLIIENPTRPKDIGMNEDTRALGIALIDLTFDL